MKNFLLALLCLLLSSCTVNRFYYVAEEPIAFYEFPSFSGQPVLTVAVGDTVWATGTKQVGLGGNIPVDYKGFRFYSPSAKARFIAQKKIKPSESKVIAGVAYEAIQRNVASKPGQLIAQAKEDSINRVLEADSIWYGKIYSTTDIYSESWALSKVLTQLPTNTIVRVQRYDYNYWKVWLPDGRMGYVREGFISTYSRTKEPFVATAYRGATYRPDYGSKASYSTPATGATIHVGPKGGQYYINSNGNKIYLRKDSPYRIGGSRSSSFGTRSSSSGNRGKR